MALLIPGQVLTSRLDNDVIEALGPAIHERITQLEDEYAPYFKAIAKWWKWYDAEPRTPRKNFPFKDASNIVVPFIKQQADAALSRTYATMTRTDRIWLAKSENTKNERLAANVARRINWGARGNDFDFKLFLYDWLSELYPIGQAVAAINWRADIRPVFYGPGTSDRAKLKYQNVVFAKGPIIEHSARENFLWDTRYHIAEAPLVSRRHQYTWPELSAMAQLDKAWDGRVLEESVKGHPDAEGSSSADAVDTYKRMADHRALDPTVNGDYDIREVHVDWPILGQKFIVDDTEEDVDVPRLPIVAHLHMGTKRIVRLTAEPYHIIGKPFFASHFRKKSGRHTAHGIAKHLEQPQSIQTTLFNQAIDAQTRANAIWAKTRNRKHIQEPIDVTKPIFVSDMNEFQELKLNPGIQPNLALMTAANVIGERLTGMADPALGRETRSGGHPSPATSTLALMEQADLLSASTEVLIQHEVARMGQALAVLYQQFDTNEDGYLQRVFGEGDAADIEEFLFPQEPIPGNYMFDVVAFSGSFNPDVQMRRAITVGQAHMQYWSFVLQGAQAIESPQLGPVVKTSWVRAIEGATKTYERFLEASDIDDMEKFLAEIDKLGQYTAESLRQFAGQAGELAATRGGVQEPGMAGPPGNVPGGAGGALAGIGVL